MQEAQNKVSELAAEHKLNCSTSVRLHDLSSEVGELSKAYLKATDYGRKEFILTQEWADELGDVAFSLCCVANSTGVDLNTVLDTVLEKYRNRFAKTGSQSSPTTQPNKSL